MNLQLHLYPNEILTKKCTNTEFPTIDEAIGSLEIMLKHNGVGIAAPQVGLDKRFFWAFNKLYINPTITKYGKQKILMTEGCLSLPNEQYNIIRSYNIVIKYYSYLGKINEYGLITEELFSFDAIVAQHEYDHLDGILINNKVNN